jgi:stearoyl-CoA desaturase (delta-9 desaturase)
MKGQLDSSARLIWVLEKLRLASDVRWPDAGRLAAKQTGSAGRRLVATAKQG